MSEVERHKRALPLGVVNGPTAVIDLLRLAEHTHGHLGWLAAAALAHPAILLRDHRRRADLSVILSVLLVTAVAGLGFLLYVEYINLLKQQMFLSAPRMGILFERKEHLAFAAMILAWTAAVCYFGARAAREPLRLRMRKAAHRGFVVSAALCFAVAVMGTIVASYKTF